MSVWNLCLDVHAPVGASVSERRAAGALLGAWLVDVLPAGHPGGVIERLDADGVPVFLLVPDWLTGVEDPTPAAHAVRDHLAEQIPGNPATTGWWVTTTVEEADPVTGSPADYDSPLAGMDDQSLADQVLARLTDGPRAPPGGRANVVPVTDPPHSGFDPGPGTSGDFGALARQSGRMLNALGNAQITGAENLLTKAIRALTTRDAQRAEMLIRRAGQMPYDDREDGSPGVRAASMLVYMLITDQFEACEEDDMTWLDVVLAVHPGLDPTGRADVASVVHGFVLQTSFFTVSPAEKRRIRQAFGDAPLEPELGDSPNSTVEQRQDIITSLVVAAVALGEAYAAATPQPQV